MSVETRGDLRAIRNASVTVTRVKTGLGRDDQLVAIVAKIVGEDATEVYLGGTLRCEVIDREIEMSHPRVECASHEHTPRIHWSIEPKGIPQTEGNPRKFQPASPGSHLIEAVVAIGHAS